MSVVKTSKILINTVVRVLPIGLYLATLLSSMMLENKVAMILFFGQLLNDIIGLCYRFILKPSGKIQCAMVRVGDLYYTMPAPHIQIVSFYFSFFMAEMYFNGKFNSMKFLGLLGILLMTVWSRLDVECKDMLDITLAFSLGCGIGLSYYLLVREYYENKNSNLDIITDSQSNNELINNVFKYFD
jgi:hypothetical protein